MSKVYITYGKIIFGNEVICSPPLRVFTERYLAEQYGSAMVDSKAKAYGKVWESYDVICHNVNEKPKNFDLQDVAVTVGKPQSAAQSVPPEMLKQLAQEVKVIMTDVDRRNRELDHKEMELLRRGCTADEIFKEEARVAAEAKALLKQIRDEQADAEAKKALEP
jgi:cell division protein ZapA (FtsZ GTPase activity inhibitor)